MMGLGCLIAAYSFSTAYYRQGRKLYVGYLTSAQRLLRFSTAYYRQGRKRSLPASTPKTQRKSFSAAYYR